MVQRKVPDKYALLVDDVMKTEKRAANLKHLFQRQDVKSRGPEMKKKMKKSRTIKVSGHESLRSSSSWEKAVSQTGRPPPFGEVTPQKQPVIRSAQGSPNYMKGTSSWKAKRQSSQVSPGDSPNLRRRSSSDSKIGRPLSRTSSLKKVRSLTKTPSFKPVRAKSAKKCSGVALYSDVDVQRATCSSTLKEAKFPAYLELNPGGCEAEGTSAMKVCPYTYCSLNGYHHNTSPPLKSFLLARRQLLKIQQGTKLEAMTPCEADLSDPDTKGIKKKVIISNEKLANEELDFTNSPKCHLNPENERDFFVEIFTKDMNYYSESSGGNTQEYHDDEDDTYYEGDSDTTVSNLVNIQVTESLSSGPPHSETDLEDDFKHFFDSFSIDIDTIESFIREQETEDLKDDHTPSAPMGETMNFCNLSNCEAADMEWKHEKFFALKPDEEADQSAKPGERIDPNDGSTSIKFLDNHKKITPDETSQDIIEDENAYNNAHSDVSDSDMDATWKHPEILGLGPTSESSDQDQFSLNDAEAVEIVSNEEKNQAFETNFTGTLITLPALEEPIIETAPTNDDKELQIYGVSDLDNNTPENDASEGEASTGVSKGSNTNEDATAEILLSETKGYTSGGQHQRQNAKNQNLLEKDKSEAKNSRKPNSVDPENQADSGKCRFTLPEDKSSEAEEMEQEAKAELDTAEISPRDATKTNQSSGSAYCGARKSSKQELPSARQIQRWIIKHKILMDDSENSKKFKPREPNYLPIIPEPDAEKVDLRHQEAEDRKNAEEWMLDYALQKAVTQLAPARKRKVALLVEAFETVMPISKCQPPIRQSSAAFDHGRTIQACN